MGLFSNLFKKNKPKMIEAPKEDEIREEGATIISNSETISELSQNSMKPLDGEKREIIICQFDQALKEYDEWYSKAFHDEKEKYKGAIDIVGVRDGEDLVILNYKSAKTKEMDKIALAVVKIPGEKRAEKLKYLRQRIDQMIYSIYNKNMKSNNMKAYLQEKMDEIKSEIFDIEFTYEGNHLLLNKGAIIDKTVDIEMEHIGVGYMIKDYKKQFNTFELPDEAYSYQTTVTRRVKKMDERTEEKYRKEHYISDLQNLGRIAGIIGLLPDTDMERGTSTIEYSNALRDAVIMLRNSKYAKDIENISARDELQKNVKLIAECVKELIGDTSAYYENVTEEAVEGVRYSNIEVDKDVLSAVLRLGKNVTYERAEQLKQNDAKINEEISRMVSEKDKQFGDEQTQKVIEKAKNEDIQLIANNHIQGNFRAGIKVSESQLTKKLNLDTQEKTTEKSTRTTDESEISDN